MQGIPAPPVVSKGNGPTDASTTRTADAIDATLPQAQSTDAPISVSIAGDANGDFAGVNLLEELMKDDSGLAISTRVINPPKVDANGALMLSDAPKEIRLVGSFVGQFIYLDTIGYQSISITSGALIAAITCSNDGLNWNILNGENANGGGASSNTVTSSTYLYPCVGRYLRFQVSTIGIAVAYLRGWPVSSAQTNLSSISGASANSGGQSGGLNVTGVALPGAVTVGGPLPMGGIDSGTPGVLAGVPVTRNIRTDNLGRLQTSVFGISESPNANAVQRQIGVVPTSMQNTPAVNVQDTSQFEGQTRDELLSQILQELRVNNHLLHELPLILAANLQGSPKSPQVGLDDPADLRNDPTIIN